MAYANVCSDFAPGYVSLGGIDGDVNASSSFLQSIRGGSTKTEYIMTTDTATSSNATSAPQTFESALAEAAPTELSIRTLLDAGAHFGHQTERWNPKMIRYIYGERNGIHIINLDLTLQAWNRARQFIWDRIASGGSLLVVGTKIQVRDIVQREAQRSGAFYVTSRWLGGTLTNFQTIRNSIDKMRKLEDLLNAAEDEKTGVRLNKKEKLNLSRQLQKLEANIGGIRGMKRAPDVLFVFDVNKEHIAVSEARRLKIPVVALADTNVDPDLVDYPIPSNDDAARAIKLFMGALSDVVIDAKKVAETRPPREEPTETSGEGRSHGRRSRGEGRHHAAERPAPVAPVAPVEENETPAAPPQG
jgi:small subunit ribosomal protein S2